MPTSGGSGDHSRAIWTRTDAFATVTVDRALILGEVAWVQTDATARWSNGELVWVSSRREISVPACPATSEPPTPVAPVTPTPVPVDQTPAQITAALKTTGKQLGKLDPAKLARKASFALTFAAPAAGTARLHLTAKANGKTIALGEGSAKATKAQTLKVSVKLPKAVRALAQALQAPERHAGRDVRPGHRPAAAWMIPHPSIHRRRHDEGTGRGKRHRAE